MQFDGFASATHQDLLPEGHATNVESSTFAPRNVLGTTALLQRLAMDDAFRRAMETDPVSAFSQYGFNISRDTAPQTVTLPSKADIEKNIDVLALQTDATSGWIVFCR